MKSQTTLKNAKVIKKIGKWTIEVFENPAKHTELVVSDGLHTYYPIVYDNMNVAYDNPYPIPKAVRDYIEKNKIKLKKIQDEK